MAEDLLDPAADDAADYVLGLQTPDERRGFLRRLAREPDLVEEVAAWQRRLAPLTLALPPVAPPPELLSRIARSIDSGPEAAANDRGPGWWRPGAIAAALTAAVLGGVVARDRHAATPPASPTIASVPRLGGGTMLAALSSAGSAPGLFVRYDRATDRITVVPIGLSADEAHSLQLWMIRGKAAPSPLGLLNPARPTYRAAQGRIADDVVFAVSREPRGGSPTGLPTGPVLYSGSLVRLPTT